VNLSEMMLRHKTQNTAFSWNVRLVCIGRNFDGVDRPASQAIHGTEDMNRTDEIELIDRRHGNDDDAATRSQPRRSGPLRRAIHAHLSIPPKQRTG
jgi:hypothetical protein